MGLFDGAKANAKGSKGYQLHASANQLSDAGKIAEARQKYTEALKMYAEAHQLGFKRASILQGYAILLMREGDLEKGREIMLEIEKIKGLTEADWYNLRLNYSIYQWKKGMLDKAMDTIRRASGGKMNGSVYNTLGMYMVDQARETGDFDEALKFNMEALDYDDEDAATLDNLGQLYEAMYKAAAANGEPEQASQHHTKALDYLKKAHKIKPRQITTIYYLSRMYHEDGDVEQARKVIGNADNLYYSALCPITKQTMDDLKAAIGEEA